jgi:hypothetical protein
MMTRSVHENYCILEQEMPADGCNSITEAIRICCAAAIDNRDTYSEGYGFTSSVPPPMLLTMTAEPTRPLTDD